MKKFLLIIVLFAPNQLFAEKIYSDDVQICDADGNCSKPKRNPNPYNPADKMADIIKQAEERIGDGEDPTGEQTAGTVSSCKDGVKARVKKTGDIITLYRCLLFVPHGATSKNPLDGDFYEDSTQKVAFPKSVISYENGEYLIDLEVPKVSLKGVPNKFNCNRHNELTENQCLVCNCFHEARNTSYEEMFYINRVVHSRVIDKAFPREIVKDLGNDICNVVYDGISGKNPPWAQFSWTVEKIPGTETPKQRMQIGYGANLGSSDKAAYSRCVSAAKKSLDYKDEYFASHYLTKETIRQTGWIGKCEEASKGMYIDTGRETGVTLAHRFYPVCNNHEQQYIEEAKTIRTKKAGNLE